MKNTEERYPISSGIRCQFFRPSELESPADRKPESISLTGQENSRGFLGHTEFCIRIVVIDQAERYVNDRNLDSQLEAEAGSEISDLAESCFIDAKQRVLLYFAAKVELIDTSGEAGRTAEPIAAAEEVSKLSLRQ